MLELANIGNPLTQRLLTQPITIDARGMVRLSDRPGLGVELDVDFVTAHRVA
jgi:L-alanine-DL-glutamate epimerase-like enolase superfamily enzyme